ncbi:PREDICTED: uncharacterized protein LOC105112372 [Populus euphratica]|uniref:Uncharacterized protein LOC105112372 n=1 Tax=Populus euphratica TaxID=75702 RepID=A0AAJ6T838_POPEU|nr:PREDICTED: uncharacterized protein LOC105112372 [Populus euphratica]
MKNIDSSTSRIEEREEEVDFLFVTEKDLKDENIDINAKVTGFDALVAVCHIAYKKLKQKKREEKQKAGAILGDGNIDGPVREKTLKNPADYFELKKKERFAGEKLISSAKKSGGTSNGGGILRRRFNKVNEPMSDQVHDGFAPRKRTSEERPSCSTESYERNGFRQGLMTGASEGGSNQDMFSRKDTVFKRSHAHSMPNKRLKEEMPNCGVGSLAELLPHEVKERIASMKGKDVELVVDKQLYATDMEDGNSRLSIPLRQVIAKNFLSDEEKGALIDGNCLKVKILEPSLEMVSDMNLKQWNMFKEKGSKTTSTLLLLRLVKDKKNEIVLTEAIPVHQLVAMLVWLNMRVLVLREGLEDGGSSGRSQKGEEDPPYSASQPEDVD